MHSFSFALLFFAILSTLLTNTHATQIDIPPALIWNITVSTPKGKTIISNVCGKASKGKLHAIMGPSGSGKSTLLNALAGVVPKKSLTLQGYIYSQTSAEAVYIEQEDLLFAQLSVSETISTSLALKKTEDIEADRVRAVDKTILSLGLKKSRSTPVGDKKTRGLSGGEKKRLSIGTELIGLNEGSAVIFADEPTSGLDSFQAERVTQILKQLANEGNTVIASIHQPRASIFAMFDEITLMSEGSIMYSGESSQMASYFASIGYPCPTQVSPAEYYVDLVSVDYSSIDKEQESKLIIKKLDEYMRKNEAKHSYSEDYISQHYGDKAMAKAKIAERSIHGSFIHKAGAMIKKSLSKFVLLYTRAWRNMSRDKSLNIARLMSSLFSALLFGAIYYKLGDGASTVPDRLGLLQVAAVNTAMLSLIKATTSFVTEKLIIQRERRSGAYGVIPYFVSKLFAEAPISAFFPCLSSAIMYKLCGLNPAPGRFIRFLTILVVESFASSALGMSVGSLANSVESAIAIAPAVMVIFIVFGGLYVVNTPSYLAWVPNASLIRWAYEALAVNEFSGLKFRPEAEVGPKAVTRGEQVLDSMGYGQSTVKKALMAQSAIILINYLFTCISLVLQRPSFEKIKPINDEDADDKSPITSSTLSASTNKSPLKPALPKY